jgi:hypothetical protein
MRYFVILLGMGLLLSGCASGPVISKLHFGNLEISVSTTEGEILPNAELYLDNLFVGNFTQRLPVIHARRGERLIRVECSGYKPYEKKINILGDPNHQVLNVILEKE